jgi:hypothetical protein
MKKPVEDLHLVLTWRDVENYLSMEQKKNLAKICHEIAEHRKKNGQKYRNDYLVINDDEAYSEHVREIMLGKTYRTPLHIIGDFFYFTAIAWAIVASAGHFMWKIFSDNPSPLTNGGWFTTMLICFFMGLVHMLAKVNLIVEEKK